MKKYFIRDSKEYSLICSLDMDWIFFNMSQDATMLKKIPIFLDKCKYSNMLAMSQYTCGGVLRQIA
jgi:hypothetical protein